MNVQTIIDALALPPDARVDQRVPKKLLLEQGAPTAADKRQISAGIEQMSWIAALKPTNIGVPEYQDAVREYLEIAVLTVALRPVAKPPRLIELIHRAIPYPVVLITEHGDTTNLSLAHKRWSQGETGKTVLDGEVMEVEWSHGGRDTHERDFLAAMALARQPRSDLSTVYQGWIDRLNALSAAQITGAFTVPANIARAAVVREGLETYHVLNRDLAGLRAQAKRDKQLNRRVELNLEIKRLEAKLAQLVRELGPRCPETASRFADSGFRDPDRSSDSHPSTHYERNSSANTPEVE